MNLNTALKDDPDHNSPEPRKQEEKSPSGGFFHWFKNILRTRSEGSLREAISEFIENNEENPGDSDTITAHERLLLSNILSLREDRVAKVMVPRADIFALDVTTSQSELLALLSERQFSRIPIYRDTLDDVMGTIHIKDILAALSVGKPIKIEDLITETPIVSPALPVLDLLLIMRQSRRHMALVVDEFGGIDGLVTINDIVENIVGEIDDEHDNQIEALLIDKGDGTLIAEGRVAIETFEERYGHLLSDEERSETDTLGGLVFYLAGRVPARGEVLTHSSGMIFEILEADPRRVERLRIRNVPAHKIS
jgi:CBS domain containing-hemolysin-like protein